VDRLVTTFAAFLDFLHWASTTTGEVTNANGSVFYGGNGLQAFLVACQAGLHLVIGVALP
jgi:hypothetical protein